VVEKKSEKTPAVVFGRWARAVFLVVGKVSVDIIWGITIILGNDRLFCRRAPTDATIATGGGDRHRRRLVDKRTLQVLWGSGSSIM
jgi:hypothetical protein